MRHSWSRLRGFTLVELLVVIAIIGILIALLLPAVQAAREAARRSQCTNNLKQMAIAVHNYHDVNKTFPPGNIMLNAANNTTYGANWAIMILPFIEQKSLLDQYNPTLANNAQPQLAALGNSRVIEQMVPTYMCPSDKDREKLETPGSGSPNSGFRHGSYRAIGGFFDGSTINGTADCYWDNEQSTDLPSNWKGAMHIVGDYVNASNTPPRNITRWQSESFASIKDGTANTLLIGEYATRTQSNRGAFWGFAYGSYSVATIIPQAYLYQPDYNQCCADGTDNFCKRAVASQHPGGMNFGLCDGSVRFVSSTVDLAVLGAAATVAGAEARQLP